MLLQADGATFFAKKTKKTTKPKRQKKKQYGMWHPFGKKDTGSPISAAGKQLECGRWGMCTSEGPKHRIEDRWIVLNKIHPLPPSFEELPSLNPPRNLATEADSPPIQMEERKEDYGRFLETQRGEIPDESGNLPSYWAIYDGHGGSKCGDYVRQVLHMNILRSAAHLLWTPEATPKAYGSLLHLPHKLPYLHHPSIQEALVQAFQQTEEDFKRIAMDLKTGSGSCVVVVLEVRGYLFVANLGDSRAVVGRKRHDLLAFYLQSLVEPVKLTYDHKPTNKPERLRIEALLSDMTKAMGATKTVDTPSEPKAIHKGRAFGVLAVSRSLGDLPLKIPLPPDELLLFRNSKSEERSEKQPVIEAENVARSEEGLQDEDGKESKKETSQNHRDEKRKRKGKEKEIKHDKMHGAEGELVPEGERPEERRNKKTSSSRWELLEVVPGVVSSEPEIRVHSMQERDWFIVLASDGLWDVCNNFYVVETIASKVSKGIALDAVAQFLVEEARRRGSHDDITVIIVVFDTKKVPRDVVAH